MIRTPDSRAQAQYLESLTTGQLFGLFEACRQAQATGVPAKDLAVAWGLLFSGIYLSGEELVSGMQKGEHPLGGEKEQVLREFLRDDCRTGGAFVLEVIRTGGTIDRAALIMLADPEDLAGVGLRGTTALHLLAEACDRTLRTAFIRMAGKTGLSSVYDNRDLPVLFTILSLGDLGRDDLIAISTVITRDELRFVKNRHGTGRSALEVYTEAAGRLKGGRAQGERNPFMLNRAVKNTNLRTGQKQPGRPGARSPQTDVMGENADDDEPLQAGRSGIRKMLAQPHDMLGDLKGRKPGRK